MIIINIGAINPIGDILSPLRDQIILHRALLKICMPGLTIIEKGFVIIDDEEQ